MRSVLSLADRIQNFVSGLGVSRDEAERAVGIVYQLGFKDLEGLVDGIATDPPEDSPGEAKSEERKHRPFHLYYPDAWNGKSLSQNVFSMHFAGWDISPEHPNFGAQVQVDLVGRDEPVVDLTLEGMGGCVVVQLSLRQFAMLEDALANIQQRARSANGGVDYRRVRIVNGKISLASSPRSERSPTPAALERVEQE